MSKRYLANETIRLLIRKAVLEIKVVFLQILIVVAKAENLILKIRYLRSKGGYGPTQIVKLLPHLPKLSVHEMDLLVLAND